MQNILVTWNDGASRQAILDFVARITREGTPDFVEPEARIAVFDNDGTLWCEKPLPVQADFLFRYLTRMVEQDPALRARQPWKAVFEKDYGWLGDVITKHYRGDDSDLKLMEDGLLQCYRSATVEEFDAAAGEFLRTARHPLLHRPYLKCAYQPMIELMRYFEANRFTNYIATGGGRDFMRPVTQELYGVPPERVIGSSVTLKYHEQANGPASIMHTAELDIFDDGFAKPVRIWSRTGRRPIFAAGNSNGDIPMLHYCASQRGPSLALLINHDDGDREYAYRTGAEDALKRAQKEGWGVVGMKADWNTVFAAR